MESVDLFTSVYRVQPQSFGESLSNFVENYFYLGGRKVCVIDAKGERAVEVNGAQSWWVTALKVASYVILPISMALFALKLSLRWIYGTPKIEKSVSPDLQRVIDAAPAFAEYKIAKGTPYQGATLTSMSLRPANLFFHALLGPNATTLPGSGQLFAFRQPAEQIRNQITQTDPNQVVAFSARGVPGTYFRGDVPVPVPDLSAVYGNSTYRISYGELQETLASQKIYLAPRLPLLFYTEFKRAMERDGIVALPGHGGRPVLMRNLPGPNCRAFLNAVGANPLAFGFASQNDFDQIMELTIYQLGSMVVKVEDFRIFMDQNGQILERNPGERDTIRLINACGIRGVHHTGPTQLDNRTIMTETFSTALTAAENGMVVFPAVGMGVWGGDPDLYWRAFLDAVVANGAGVEKIFVNPGHQKSPNGPYRGHGGDEFKEILAEYLARFKGDEQALLNLNKVIDLYDRKTDVIHFAHQLKRAFPDKIISLFNASDPDVTLGFVVGEYVNNLNHPGTTEENYTAMGTNGLCFERITGVHNDPRRIIKLLAR